MTHTPALTLFQIPAETREAVRKSLRDLAAAGESVSVRKVAKRAKTRTQSAGLLLRAYELGLLSLDVAWDGSLVQEDLARRVQEATTDRERAQLCNDLAAALHMGLVEPVVGRAMGSLIAEARLCERAARESEGEVEAQSVYLLSDEAIVLARAFDFLVSPELRAEAIAAAEARAQRDLERFPNPTPAEIEALRAEATHERV